MLSFACQEKERSETGRVLLMFAPGANTLACSRTGGVNAVQKAGLFKPPGHGSFGVPTAGCWLGAVFVSQPKHINLCISGELHPVMPGLVLAACAGWQRQYRPPRCLPQLTFSPNPTCLELVLLLAWLQVSFTGSSLLQAPHSSMQARFPLLPLQPPLRPSAS